jgi:hypothetical protein
MAITAVDYIPDVLLVPLLLCLVASSADAFTCRPNGTDISTRLPDGAYTAYFPTSGLPHTSSQSERDCLEWSATDRMVELIVTAGDLAPNATNKALDGLSLAFTRISTVSPYEGAMQKTSGGTWVVPVQGRHYQVEQKAFAAFRAELTSSSKRAKAAARFVTLTDLRNLLDVDPTFTPNLHAPFVDPVLPPMDTARANLLPVDTRTTLPACGNGDCSSLAATHAAHACVTNARCNGTPVSACPSVGLAHVAYENACAGNERCEAFRRMKPFRGSEDTVSWTRPQLCQIARLQDVMHHRWMAAQQAGDWKASRKADTNHLMLHVAMNVGNPRMRLTFMCDGADAQDLIGCFGGDQPMRDLLPKLVEAYLR